MWKRLRDWLSLIADFLQLAGFLGWTPAAVVSLLAFVVGWITHVQTFWVIVATPVAFAASLALTHYFVPRLGTVTLKEGARIAYEQLRGTLWAEAAERLRVDGTQKESSTIRNVSTTLRHRLRGV
jgi:hypothetical protein